MRLRYSIYTLIAVFLLAACGKKEKSFTVVADIEGMPVQQVSLVTMDSTEHLLVLDSVTADANGHFQLKGRGEEPNIYQLRFAGDPQRFIMLSLEEGQANVKGKWDLLQESYTVDGSPASASLRTLLQVMREHMRDMYTYNMIADSAQAKKDDSMLTRVQGDMANLNKSLTGYIENYADTTKHVANAIFAARILNPHAEENYLNTFVASLDKRFPNSSGARAFKQRFSQTIAATQQQMAPPPSMPTGMDAHEISMPTPEGKTVKLSSFRGKYVLIDFWASWCGPCRAENPNVVAAYNKFKDKNFTILGVSLDDNKDKWVEAIKADGLTWTHVSDLQRWENVAARDYEVQSIPANFLIDPYGKIVARDLRGPALEATLAEMVK